MFKLRVNSLNSLNSQGGVNKMGFLDMALAVKEKPVRVNRPAVQVKEPAPGVEIPDMRLSEFARSEGWLRIQSAVLGEEIILAADNAMEIPSGFPIYRASEIRSLMGRAPEAVRDVHRVKKAFQGVLTGIKARN
jgi:hypothetical protein